jgi:hypothetical protein
VLADQGQQRKEGNVPGKRKLTFSEIALPELWKHLDEKQKLMLTQSLAIRVEQIEPEFAERLIEEWIKKPALRNLESQR